MRIFFDDDDDLTGSASESSRKSRIASIKLARPSALTVETLDTVGSDDYFFRYESQRRNTHLEVKPLQTFCTGSKYVGQWNMIGFAGKGVYKFPHGVIYDGEFNRNGDFHGRGTLIYPNGARLEGLWCKGRIVGEPNHVDETGELMDSDYCKVPDRRFQLELHDGLNPAGQELETNAPNPPRKIPPGCYDMGLGFYNPHTHSISDYEQKEIKTISEIKPVLDLSMLDDLACADELKRDSSLVKIIRHTPTAQVVSDIPMEMMEQWIIRNCRRAWEEPTGYIPQLYEDWNYGLRFADLFTSSSQQMLLDKRISQLDTEVEEIVSQSLPQVLKYNRRRYTEAPTMLLQSIGRIFGKGRIIRGSVAVDQDDGRDSALRRLSTFFKIEKAGDSTTKELMEISNLFGMIPKDMAEDDYEYTHEVMGPVCRLRVGFRKTIEERTSMSTISSEGTIE